MEFINFFKSLSKKNNINLNNDKNSNNINLKNDKIANELKEMGNKEYLKNNYLKAFELYHNALQLDGISNYTKSLLHLNKASATIEVINDNSKVISQLIQDYEKFDHIKMALSEIEMALLLRPDNYPKAYFKYGKLLSKLGLYNIAINSFNSVIYIENSNTSSSSSPSSSTLKEESIQFIKQLEIKLNQSRVYFNDDTHDRDFTKETTNQINASNFNFSKIDKNIGNLKEWENVSKILGISKKLVNELYTQKMSMIHSNNQEEELSIEYCKRMIGNNTILAHPYISLALYYTSNSNEGGGANNELIVPLLLNASSKSLTLFNLNENQIKKLNNDELVNEIKILVDSQREGVIASHIQLASIYKYGLFKQDFDLERVIYHLEYVISNLNEDDVIDQQLYSSVTDTDDLNCPFFSLGQLYYFGKTSFKGKIIIDREKAKMLFIKGAIFGSVFCKIYLNRYFKNDNDQVVKSIIYNIDSSIKNKVNDSIGMSIAKDDYAQIVKDIDFKKLISISKNGKSQFASFIHSTTISKVQSFIQSFSNFEKKQHQTGSSSINDKLKLIKQLSLIYETSFEYCQFIRIPDSMVGKVKEIVLELMNELPLDLDVIIVYLGLNRFDFKHVDKSIHYLGEFENQFKLSLGYCDDGNSGNGITTGCVYNNEQKDVFLYLTLSIVQYLDYNDLSRCGGTTGITKIVFASLNGYVSRSPNDSPCLAELYFNLSLLLLKLSNGKRIYDNDIKKYYQLGCKVKQLVIPLLDCYHNLEKSFKLINDQLTIHFGTTDFS